MYIYIYIFELFLNYSYNVLTPYYILQLHLICFSVCNVSCGCLMLMLSSLGIFKRERERERELISVQYVQESVHLVASHVERNSVFSF